MSQPAFDPTDVSLATIRKISETIQPLLTSDFHEALRLSELAITLSLELGDPLGKAIALRAKGSALIKVDEPLKALEYFDRALVLFDSVGSDFEAAKTRMNRIACYSKLSRFDEGLAEADLVTHVLQRLGAEELLGGHLLNVANIYFRLDEFRKDLALLETAEGIMKKHGNKRALSTIYVNRAVALTSLNDAPQSLKYYEMAKDLAAEMNMPT